MNYIPLTDPRTPPTIRMWDSDNLEQEKVEYKTYLESHLNKNLTTADKIRGCLGFTILGPLCIPAVSAACCLKETISVIRSDSEDYLELQQSEECCPEYYSLKCTFICIGALGAVISGIFLSPCYLGYWAADKRARLLLKDRCFSIICDGESLSEKNILFKEKMNSYLEESIEKQADKYAEEIEISREKILSEIEKEGVLPREIYPIIFDYLRP